MKILLIFLRIEHGQTTVKDKGSWSSILFGNPIITLPHVASITPKEHSVKIINENYGDIDFNANIDLVGITCYTMTAPHVYEIADEFRSRGKKLFLEVIIQLQCLMKQNNMPIVSFREKQKQHDPS